MTFSSRKIFAREELEKYDSSGGVAYITFGGRVHDVSRGFHWKNGIHQITHPARRDLTEALNPVENSLIECHSFVTFLRHVL